VKWNRVFQWLKIPNDWSFFLHTAPLLLKKVKDIRVGTSSRRNRVLPAKTGPLFSEAGPLRGLRELDVFLDEHLALQFLQHRLDRVLSVPTGQDSHSAGVHHSSWGDAVHVNPGAEPHGGCLVRVLGAARYL